MHVLLLLCSASYAIAYIVNYDTTMPQASFVRPQESNFTASVGDVVILKCAVKNLGSAKISWRRVEDNTLLTVGTNRFTSDQRFSIDHVKDKSEWNLIITSVELSDSAFYECQIIAKDIRRHIAQLMVFDPQRRLVSRNNAVVYARDMKDQSNANMKKRSGSEDAAANANQMSSLSANPQLRSCSVTCGLLALTQCFLIRQLIF